ncbi:hypothetical protein INE88_03806 [Bacteroides eggerthii]|uniref:Uncharacterized protein n=2 Tax=Bacteroides eggerthii TaxID=28111 RepID=A0A975KJB7_9BACE|nr:hypothetical protein INE88_03806 [Bacteroides eggerthii]
MANLLNIKYILSIMRELSIQIKVRPVNKMRQDIYHFTADEFTFSPISESSAAGRCFNCNKDITIDLPPENVITDFLPGRFAIVEFTDTRHRNIQIGDNKLPAIVAISPNLNSATLKIECKMLKSPFL